MLATAVIQPSTEVATDVAIMRELAKRYVAICQNPVQAERRRLWRRLHTLKATRPLIYVRAYAWAEMPESQLHCQDSFYRKYENFFRSMLFQETFNDDFIFEPWVTVRAVCEQPFSDIWGVKIEEHRPEQATGARVWDSPLKNPEDFEKLRVTPHHINEAATQTLAEKLHHAIGDIITINIDRGPVYGMWDYDISTQLGKLRGMEKMMLDMIDQPEWLHRVLAFMRDGILQSHQEAENAGDWRLCNHTNQSMPYAEELKDPAANSESVTRSQLWGFLASQETTLVSPTMFDEFMLQYQIPIMEKFGLSAYGCCEDLSRKIKLLRRVRNLRRIAVSPFANVAKCVEQIGTDYVISYRPSPADMLSYDFNPERIRSILRRDLALCRECHLDITLKDVETVQRDPHRVRNWVAITREIMGELGWQDN